MTMASEVADRIEWPLTHTLMGITPWANHAQYKSVQHVPGVDLATLSIRGNHIAYAATQRLSFS